MCRSGWSAPAGPAITPHASPGWSRRACAMIASTNSRAMVSTVHSLSCGGALPGHPRRPPMTADLILHGGVVHAVAGPFSQPGAAPTAVAVRGGRIIAVGRDDEIHTHAGPRTHLVDLGGGALVPGFQDAHCHPVSGGLERTRCDLDVARNQESYLAAIGAYAAANPQ